MKKWALWLLILMLFPVSALAEIEITLSVPVLAVESTLDFEIQAPGAQEYRYTLYRDEKKLFTTKEIPYAFGSYLPMKEGEYTLLAEARGDGNWESAQAAFTVTGALSCTLAPLPRDIRAGDGVLLQVNVQGGDGRYRYLYEITEDGREDAPLLRQEGADTLLWVPGEAGHYRLSIQTADGMGAFARQEIELQVLPGPGISWKADSGSLLSGGGQKSYTIYAQGPWTARSQCDFIRVLQGQGMPGDLLIVEIDQATHAYRSGKVLLECNGKQAEMTIGQSAQTGLDEEISIVLTAPSLLVDGSTHALWLSAEGKREFAISSQGVWQAETQAEFIRMEKSESGLILSLAQWEGSGVRQGMVTLSNADSQAAIHIYQPGSSEKAPALFLADTPFPQPQAAEKSFITYSQCSGYWKDKKYRTSTLEHSGCAIFALSHALQHLGYEGDEILPENLAQTYAFALLQGGTMNSTLVGHAGDDFGFKTRYDLYQDLPTIRSKMRAGAVYSFGVVTGHIAMIIEMNEEGTMFRVVDSAPSATWERIKNASLYLRQPDGSFAPIQSLSEIPGLRYYIETEAFGGATYWLEGSYIAKRGVRLIQPR